MENFQNSIVEHLKAVLREVHWYESGLENMPFKLVRAENWNSPNYSSYDWDDDWGYDYLYTEDFYLGEDWGPTMNRLDGRRRFERSWRQYAFKCKSMPEDHWDLYTLTNYVNYHDWSKRHTYRDGWHLYKCGLAAHHKVFLTSDFYDLTPEMLFGKVQEFLVMLVMEDV